MRSTVIVILVSALIPSLGLAHDAPVFVVTPVQSSIKFNVFSIGSYRGYFRPVERHTACALLTKTER